MNTNLAARAAAAAMILLVLLTGCSVRSTSDLGGGAPAVAPQPAEVAPAAGDAASEAERQVARTGAIELVVVNPADAAARVREVAGRFDALVTWEDVRSVEASSSSTVTLSVPATSLDALLDALAGLGTVTHRSTTAVDVTEQLVDVDARIRTLQDSIGRLRELMGRAGTVGDIAAVERELTTRQSDLESLLAQQKYLRDRVERATVTVTLTTAFPGGNPLLEGLGGAWLALQESVRVMLVIAGGLVPWAALLAALWFPTRWAFRRARARRATAKAKARASD